MTTDYTPEFGFPLPSDASRISALPWWLRHLSRTLEEKLPGALLAVAREFFPTEVARQAADIRARVTEAYAQATAAAADADNAVDRVQALESAAGFGPSTPTDGTMASFVTQPGSLIRRALDGLYGSAALLAQVAAAVARRGEVHPVKPGESIQAAVTAAAGRYPVRLLAGRHTPTAAITLPGGTVIEGEPGAVLDISRAPDGAVLTGGGFSQAPVTLAADTLTGTTTVTTTAPVPGLAAGDYVKIFSSRVFGLTNQPLGEIARVATVSGSTITLEDPVSDSYKTAENGQVSRLVMAAPITLRELTIEGGTDTSRGYVAVDLSHVLAPRLRDITMSRVHQAGVYLRDCVGGRLSGLHFTDARRPGFGYGIGLLYACQDTTVTGCTGFKTRHLVTVGGGSQRAGIPRRIAVAGCTSSQADEAGFDVHPAGESVSFTNCHVKGSAMDGFVLQGGTTTLSGCTVEDTVRHGILVQPRTLRGVQTTITGNTIRRAGGAGIMLDMGTDTAWHSSGDLVVQGNSISGGAHGIQAVYADGEQNFTAVDVTGNAVMVLAGVGVQVRGFPSAVISSNRVRSQHTGICIDVTDSPRTAVTGNAVDGRSFATRAINVSRSPNTALTGNTLYRAEIGVYLDDVSPVAYAGNVNLCVTKVRQGSAIETNI